MNERAKEMSDCTRKILGTAFGFNQVPLSFFINKLGSKFFEHTKLFLTTLSRSMLMFVAPFCSANRIFKKSKYEIYLSFLFTPLLILSIKPNISSSQFQRVWLQFKAVQLMTTLFILPVSQFNVYYAEKLEKI